MKTTKIKGHFVIGHDGSKHVFYRDGEVVYKDDTIIFVGKDFEGHVDEIIDTGLSIISPGFIDLEADIDTDHALIDVAFPSSPENRFVMGNKYRTIDPYTDEDFKIRQTYSIAQLIRNGITTAMPIEGETFHGWSQSYREHEIMSEVGLEMGMRLYVGPSFRSYVGIGEGYDDKRSEQSFSDALRHFEEFDGKGNGLIRGFINPCQIRWTKEDLLVRAIRYAEQKNAPMRLHACEGLGEWEHIRALGGNTTIEYFERIGLLSPKLLIPHCIVATNRELETLARYGISVISTPFAEIQGGTALFSFAKYQHYGINLTIGTDAQPVDMIRNMRLARDLDVMCHNRQIFRRYQEDGSVMNTFQDEPEYKRMTVADFFDAATVNGAKALDRTDIGKLAVGAKADIIAIDLNDIAVGPYEDPVRTMIVSCTGSNVTHTIINGKMLMKNKKLLGIDEDLLMKKAQVVLEKFLNLYQEYDQYNRPKEAFFPPSYQFMD
ncbi:chlorohydrolase family protein [Paenibacillus sp. GCM10027629]|uniref:chlorohydrolase family protein n=1 Tax=Paenibacillus sp. GCM10027629 TaxID=3273414 RepID=UPI0036286C6B